MKAIFVPVSGSQTDETVFATALAAAAPFGCHLEFYHQRLSLFEAAVRARHVDFCMGPALADALESLREQDVELSAHSRKNFDVFCAKHTIKIQESPAEGAIVTAQYSVSVDEPERHLLLHARHNDLTVLGRAAHEDLMPHNLIEMLLLDSGRPIILAPRSAPETVTGTIMVGWKETREAARALGAAIPLMKKARKVILVSVHEGSGMQPETLTNLANSLAWHGIAAEKRLIADKRERAPGELLRKAAADAGTDLLVVGGYGHRPLREAIFGGVTAALIHHAECPVLMMH
jgi:nucleotide-binding universal stress UspA family protein